MNKEVFVDRRTSRLPDATVLNEVGGRAYELSDKAALAQLVLTGCFNNTFYTTGEEQQKKILELCGKTCPTFVAKLAVYARKNGHMKDSPAVLLAWLAANHPLQFALAARHVLDGGRMVRNLVQVCRSGVTGHTAIPRPARRAIVKWLQDRPGDKLFRDTVGNDPSIADILRMLHPKPKDATQGLLWNYILGRGDEETWGHLPQVIQTYERFKRETLRGQLPDVPFQMLTGLTLTRDQWRDLAPKLSWQELRQSLNALTKHGCFDRKVGNIGANYIRDLALKLACPNEVAKARVLPYQLLTTFLHIDPAVPSEFREALQDAMEAAIKNIPEIPGEVYAFIDVSGSMNSPVTGTRKGATSKATCRQVASLIGASLLRTNKTAYVIPFSDRMYKDFKINPRDSVMTVSEQLMKLPSGGTNCAMPVQALVNGRAAVSAVIFVSDNESWMDSVGRAMGPFSGRGTALLEAWQELKKINPGAKLICIDLQPNTTTQAIDRPDIMNIGGWSDAIWPVIAGFLKGDANSTLTAEIEAVTL